MMRVRVKTAADIELEKKPPFTKKLSNCKRPPNQKIAAMTSLDEYRNSVVLNNGPLKIKIDS